MTVYKSIIAYDGTDFHGLQRLPDGRRTVQGVFEEALRELGWQGSSLRAAGRTDAGVHARGQVVDYDLSWRHDPATLTQALNAHLPGDVAVRETEPAPAGFHPRFSARRRRYHYRLVGAPQRDPLRERYAWRVWPEPDVALMREAARGLVGKHDFAAFGKAPISGGHTVRTVYLAEWEPEAESLVFRIEANAFLYRMVRRVVAALLEVGCRRRDASEFASLLNAPAEVWQGKIAPAHGLCLEAVIYTQGSPARISGESDEPA